MAIKKLFVRCPVCNKQKHIDFDNSIILNSGKSLIPIEIPKKLICEDAFMVYVDKNCVVRDCVSFDFTVELPDMEVTDNQQSSLLEIDSDKIRLNLYPTLVAQILRCMFNKARFIVIFNTPILNRLYERFFRLLSEDSFSIDITFMQSRKFKLQKNELKDRIILYRGKILNDNKKIFRYPLNFEELLAKNFFLESNAKTSSIMLKNEVLKAYLLSSTIVDFILKSNIYRLTSVSVDELIYKEHGIHLDFKYIRFLNMIINNYFISRLRNKKVKISNYFSDFL